MSLGLQYKNQEHIFDEKTVDGVPFLSYLGNYEQQHNKRR